MQTPFASALLLTAELLDLFQVLGDAQLCDQVLPERIVVRQRVLFITSAYKCECA